MIPISLHLGYIQYQLMQSVYEVFLVDLFVKVFVIFYTVDALHSVKIFFTKTFVVSLNGVFFNLFYRLINTRNINTHPWSYAWFPQRGDDIHRLGRRNLVASDSSPKVHRQSIPTTCANSILNSSSSTKRFY